MTPDPRADNSTATSISEAIHKNLEKVSQFAQREDAKRTVLQRVIERVSVFFGEPRFLLTFLCASVAWIVSDVLLHHLGYRYFDEPPFSLLQGIVTFIGVLITMAVLIRQNRLARVEEDRAHLELQINLLAEQKTTKIIMLLEELRRDLPHVPDRHDQHAETLQAATNPDAVLEAIEQRKEQRE
ncbi:DUF1003 domain-containing protein [Caballeronia sp. LZ001]|uniref:DUF1003 domain-containing protein n=1 Tax=Caballeronia sp. LZ001 TaxID=3038553 RepID=UPI00285A408B|nr:DUF1003 domain-containing protein [Caballeronia sp. LZ001]MDR5806441.1 DUF1003 domain-containing protein [Caballeronia sp. LZ001]